MAYAVKELPWHVIDAPWLLLPLSYCQVSQENKDVACCRKPKPKRALRHSPRPRLRGRGKR